MRYIALDLGSNWYSLGRPKKMKIIISLEKQISFHHILI